MAFIEQLTNKNVYTVDALAAELEEHNIEARGSDEYIYIPIHYGEVDLDNQIVIGRGKLLISPNPASPLEEQHRGVFGKFGMVVNNIAVDYPWLKFAKEDPSWDKKSIQYVVTVESAAPPRRTEVLAIPGMVPFMLYLAEA